MCCCQLAGKANPQFNPGRYKPHDQYFILDEHLTKLVPVKSSLEVMKDTTPQELTSTTGKLVWAVQYRAYGNVVRTIANILMQKAVYIITATAIINPRPAVF